MKFVRGKTYTGMVSNNAIIIFSIFAEADQEETKWIIDVKNTIDGSSRLETVPASTLEEWIEKYEQFGKQTTIYDWFEEEWKQH